MLDIDHQFRTIIEYVNRHNQENMIQSFRRRVPLKIDTSNFDIKVSIENIKKHQAFIEKQSTELAGLVTQLVSKAYNTTINNGSVLDIACYLQHADNVYWHSFSWTGSVKSFEGLPDKPLPFDEIITKLNISTKILQDYGLYTEKVQWSIERCRKYYPRLTNKYKRIFIKLPIFEILEISDKGFLESYLTGFDIYFPVIVRYVLENLLTYSRLDRSEQFDSVYDDLTFEDKKRILVNLKKRIKHTSQENSGSLYPLLRRVLKIAKKDSYADNLLCEINQVLGEFLGSPTEDKKQYLIALCQDAIYWKDMLKETKKSDNTKKKKQSTKIMNKQQKETSSKKKNKGSKESSFKKDMAKFKKDIKNFTQKAYNFGTTKKKKSSKKNKKKKISPGRRILKGLGYGAAAIGSSIFGGFVGTIGTICFGLAATYHILDGVGKLFGAT